LLGIHIPIIMAEEVVARRLSPDETPRFINIITAAFSNTAITTSFMIEIDSTPPPYPSPLIDSSRRRRHFTQGITDTAESGGELVEAGSWSAVALWEPPDFKGKVFLDVGISGPLRSEWKQRVEEAKVKHLASADGQLRACYHLAFLARNPDIASVPGSITAVIKPFLDRAKAEGVPAWLEATYPRATAVYEKHGFRLVETITFGESKVNAEGWPEEGGEGIKGYCMIFDP
jgi:hypothetical protein